MNRLTKSSQLTENEAMSLSLTDLYMRLQAYEDTGLEPEEIRELLHDGTGPLHERLGEWIDAEQEGRLLVLPCKVGDTLYEPTNSGTISTYLVRGFRIEPFDSIWVEWKILYGFVYSSISGVNADEIGKTVFLTREDAEKVLEGMNNEES